VRILIITDGSPYPVASYEAVRIYNLSRRLAREHEVWLAALVYSAEDAENALKMKRFCQGVEVAIYQHRRPPEIAFRHSDELAGKIKALASQVEFDIVQIEHSYNASYLEALPPTAKGKRILVFRNVTFDQLVRMARVEWRPALKARVLLNSLLMRWWEPRYAGRFDRCVALSEIDRAKLLAANPTLRIDVVPNGTDTRLLQPLPRQDTRPVLLYVGNMDYTANAHAAIYFCQEILPLVRPAVKDVEMWIVGSDPLPEVRRLAGDGIHVTGRVEDVVPYYRQSSVCVVPLRAGSGIRLKILESMALGRPVVSTSLGCEGLDVEDGKHIMIADSTEQFAEKTIRLLIDAALHRAIATNARQLVETRYDWDTIAQRLMRIYAELTR